jgi:hypothetical protein
MSEWRQAAQITIAEALLEYEAQQLCQELPFDIKEAFKYVSNSYPFGTRENHPYKIWLSAVKQAKELLNKYSVKDLGFINWENALKTKKQQKFKDDKQLRLF